MDDKIAIPGILLVIGALSWFFKGKLTDYDDKHKDHYRHSADLTMHETDRERYLKKDELAALAKQLENHINRDDERFDIMDKKLDNLGTDIKDVLKIVRNGYNK